MNPIESSGMTSAAKDNPLVSVIVPAYNADRHLRQCVESILGQTYVNVETIIVDDGSTDDTPQLCDDFAGKSPLIHVIHQCNQGVACARNVGLDVANGEYVTFVDSDDWLEPDAVARLIDEALCCHGCDMVIGGYTRRMVAVDGRKTAKTMLPVLLQSYELGLTSKVNDLDYLLDTKDLREPRVARLICNLDIAGYLYQCWGKLFRRSWVDGLRFKSGCSYGEDTVFVLEALARGGLVSVLSKSLYNYREEDDGLVRGFRMGKTNDFEFSHGEHIAFYQNLPVTNDQRKAIDARLANDVLWAIGAVRQAPASVSDQDRLEFIERIMRSPWYKHYLNALKVAHTDRLPKLLFLMRSKTLWRWYIKMGW